MDALTVDQFKEALPAKMKKSVNKVVLDHINQKLADPDMYETYRDNLIGYVHVMKEGKFKLTNYIDAVKYVSQKMMGKTNIAAFTATFPEKIARWQAAGVEDKDIASYVTAFNKSKLVTLLYEQTLTPFWVMNQDIYQKAINTQAEIMTTARSEKVRSDAANSLLTHLKPPEAQKLELNVGMKADSSIDALRAATEALVIEQRNALQAGSINAQQMAHKPITFENGE